MGTHSLFAFPGRVLTPDAAAAWLRMGLPHIPLNGIETESKVHHVFQHVPLTQHGKVLDTVSTVLLQIHGRTANMLVSNSILCTVLQQLHSLYDLIDERAFRW